MINKKFVNKVREKYAQQHHPKLVMAGFDGFVDEILHLVKQRISPDQYTRLEYMSEFSQRIAAAAGFSTNLEYATQQIKLGGNGPILANALLAAGHQIDYIGTLGQTAIHPAFVDFAQRCQKVTSFLDPGKTDAVEFLDGKVMLGRMQNLEKMNFSNLLKHYPAAELLKTLKQAELLVMTDWNALPGMNSLYEGFAQLLAQTDKRLKIFIDLADPAKHSWAEIKTGMLKLSKLNQQADVMLGLNENESKLIAHALQLKQTDNCQRAAAIRQKLHLYGVVIHPIAGAAVATDQENCWLDGPVTQQPKLTTGAGDNFNAGYCNGWLAGLNAAECLLTGVSTSGFYVRNCHSPSQTELLNFMQSWAEGDLPD
ncbi:MAG: PfkB family carbohydrate kinase [Candidatus Cloacimonadales bacterium]